MDKIDIFRLGLLQIASNFQELISFYDSLQSKKENEKESTITILSGDWENYINFGGGKGGTMPPKYKDGTFRQRQNGILEYRFMHLNNRYSVYGKSEEICWNKRTDTISGNIKKKDVSKSMFYEDWLYKWFDTYKKLKNGEKSLKDIKGYMTNNIIPELGKYQIKKITGFQIQEFINKFSNTPNTQKKIKHVLNGSFEKAKKLRLIQYNPCDTIELIPFKATHYRALELDEQRLIYENIKDERYKLLFYFSCCTGIRISRALEITTNNFDFDRMQITIIKKQKKGLNETYKVDFLKKLINVPQSGKLFPTLTYNSTKLYFADLYKRLNIENAKIHSFRHTFSSNCYHIGIKDK